MLKVPAGSDAGYDMPVAVINGARPGPVLAVAAGAHGSEYASILAVERLIDAAAREELAGLGYTGLIAPGEPVDEVLLGPLPPLDLR